MANPTSLILSAAMLLNWRGQRDGNARLIEAARLIEIAIDSALQNPVTRTRDLSGPLNTDEFAAVVVDAISVSGRSI